MSARRGADGSRPPAYRPTVGDAALQPRLDLNLIAERRRPRLSWTDGAGAHSVDLDGVTVVNFHIDGDRAQFDRVVALARERSILAGDANLVSPAADGFSPPLAGSIDQILVRGVELRDGPSAWPPERRVVDGRVLSDHAPVEAVVE